MVHTDDQAPLTSGGRPWKVQEVWQSMLTCAGVGLFALLIDALALTAGNQPPSILLVLVVIPMAGAWFWLVYYDRRLRPAGNAPSLECDHR